MVPISDRPKETEGPADPDGAGKRRGPPTAEEVKEEVSREILRIHEESYGKGAGHSHAFVDGDWVVVVLDELELLPNEQFLVENGHHDTVIRVRHQYQQAIQTSFRAAVERATGRNVTSFASTTSLEDPGFVCEIFRLG